MERNGSYQWILDEYPATITKEQLYKICHISKRTASHLLESELIPCKCSGKKTRKYNIATTDVVAYLESRAENPDYFHAPAGWYKGSYHGEFIQLPPEVAEKMRAYYEEITRDYRDVLSVGDVCEITGYNSTTVVNWCSKKYIHRYLIRKKYHIPKLSLLDYMMSIRFRGIRIKSKKHLAYIEELQTWSAPE